MQRETDAVEREHGFETDRAERELVRMIGSLELQPGARVTQAELCERLACKRTPVREAIQRLMHSGLIVHSPNAGICIAPLDARQYAFALDLYTAVGAWGVRQAAERATPERVVRLRELADQALTAHRAGGGEATWESAFRLTDEVFAVTENPYLIETTDRLSIVVNCFARAYYHRHPRKEPIWDILLPTIDAVCRRDADAAESAFRDSIHQIRERILRAMLGEGNA